MHDAPNASAPLEDEARDAGPADGGATAKSLEEAANPIIHGSLVPAMARFGLPLVVAMALQATFNLVAMFIVGHLPNGTESLSALAICDLVAMIATSVGNGVSNASVAIIARRDGEGDTEAVSRTTAQSLSLTVIMSFIFGVLGVVLADFVTGDMMGAKGEVQFLAAGYMRVIVGGSFSILLLLQLTAILRAVGDSRTPMILLVGSNILNLFLSVLMVYGPGQAPDFFSWGPPIAQALGISRDGVVGAATSTVISRSIAIVLGLVVLARHRAGLRFPVKLLWPIWREFRAILKIAWPNSAQFLVRVGVTVFFAAVITHRFTTATDSSTLAAFGISTRLDTVALFTGMGWGAAASTFVGQNLGAGFPDRAFHAGWLAAGLNVVLMLLVFGLYLTFAPQIIGFFDSHPPVVAAGTEYLSIVGATYAFLGVAVVLSQSLSGAGATLSSFVIDTIVLLGLLVPITLVLLAVFHLQRWEVWALIGGGNVLSAGAYAIWFMRRDWIHKEI